MLFVTKLKFYYSQMLKLIFLGSNEKSFKIKIEKIKHGYLTKQLMFSFKVKVSTTLHSYLH